MVPAFRRLESVLADIFREIEEDLRRDKAAEFWKRYGRYIVGAAAFVVAATAGYVGWKEYQLRQQLEYSERFANPYIAASRGYVDDVIEPRDTRPRVIAALEMLDGKRQSNLPRKHGNIPL